MKTGCLINLVVYLAIVFGYYQWLESTVDSPELWYLSFGVAILSWGGLAALYNAWLSARDARALRHRYRGEAARREGWTAIAGTLQAYNPLLVAPFSGKHCVMVEYELATVGPEIDSADQRIDFAGIAMVACGIQSDFDKLQLFGFPDLEHVPSRYCAGPGDRINAWQYVRDTGWKDCSGKVFAGVGSMYNALTEAADSFKYDWRMAQEKQCDWLSKDDWITNDLERSKTERAELEDDSGADPNQPDALDENYVDTEDDLDDDDLDDHLEDEDNAHSSDDPSFEGPGPRRSQYHPRMTEKRLFDGDPVVAIGHYDPLRGGLVSVQNASGLRVRLYRGSPDAVARKLSVSKYRRFFGGLAWLLAINGFVAFAIWAHHNNDMTRRDWQKQFEKAVEDADLITAEQMLARGARVDRGTNSRGQSLLMNIKDPEMAAFLINNGANVDARDFDGNTPLMFAARRDDIEKLKLLLAAGAKLETRNTAYNTTALEDAINSENEACADLLRTAGAIDVTVTAANGQAIDESHPAFAVCRQYMQAIYAKDPARLRELNSSERPATFEDIDWQLWMNTRPREPQLVSGFVNDGDATIRLTGETASGANPTWVLQLRTEESEWRVRQERWVIRGS